MGLWKRLFGRGRRKKIVKASNTHPKFSFGNYIPLRIKEVKYICSDIPQVQDDRQMYFWLSLEANKSLVQERARRCLADVHKVCPETKELYGIDLFEWLYTNHKLYEQRVKELEGKEKQGGLDAAVCSQ